MGPCVAVILPVYNGRRTIGRALKSVLAQEGDVVAQIIVIDDGSVDGSGDYAAEHGEKVTVFRTPNQGVAMARNAGLELVNAEWVAFIDADDYWTTDKLGRQLAAAKDRGAEFVCCASSGMRSGQTKPINLLSMWRGNIISTSSVLVKTKILKKIKPTFHPEMSFAEDFLTWIKCLAWVNCYYLADPLFTYVLSPKPRYSLSNILKNYIKLNYNVLLFAINAPIRPALRVQLPLLSAIASVYSLIGIMKRIFCSMELWNRTNTKRHER